jgi:lantibiotic leader peptide-processing serine protease
MKRWLSKLSIICLAAMLIVSGNPFGPDQANAEKTGEQIIVFKNDHVPQAVLELFDGKYKGVKKTILPQVGLIKVEDSENTRVVNEIKEQFSDSILYTGADAKLFAPKQDILASIAKSPFKTLALPNSLNMAADLSSVPDVNNAFFYQVLGWDIKKVTQNGETFNKQTGNHNVKVAMIDSGIDFNHPDLRKNIISRGKSFVPDVKDTQDRMGHGTMTAGAIAANGLMLGVGPNLGLIPYKVMDNWADGAESTWVIEAIIAAANDEVDVINLSLGTYKSLVNPADRAIVEGYKRAVRYAETKGVVVVASTGNENYNLRNPWMLAEQRGFAGDKQVHLPGGGLSSVISVSATNPNDQLSSYSNYGNVTIAAPGGDYGEDFESTGMLDIFSLSLTTYPTNLPQPWISQALGLPPGYTLTVGTSLAAPKVSATVGLLIAENRKYKKAPLNVNKIEMILRKSATDLGEPGKDEYFGYGLVNANNALDLIKKK